MFDLEMIAGLLDQVPLHPEMALSTVVLMFVGYALKQTPKIPNWAIVWILIVLGAIIGVFTVGQSLEGILNGILSACSAIAAHQVIKQTVKKD